MESRRFDDYEIGHKDIAGSYTVNKEELVEFARKWDPQPFHVDEEAASASIFGGLTAPSIYTLAIWTWLGNQIEPKMVSMGLLGFGNVEFPKPVRPGDRLSMISEVVEKRESKSKPDRGIISFETVVSNQNGEPVLRVELKAMVEKRTQ